MNRQMIQLNVRYKPFIPPLFHYSIPIPLVAKAVCLINSSIHGIDPFVTFVSLNNPILSMRSLTKDCTNEYHTKLGQERTDKRGVPGWAEYRSKEGYTYYYNVETDSHMWTIPEEYTGCPTILTREEIQVGGVMVISGCGFIHILIIGYSIQGNS